MTTNTPQVAATTEAPKPRDRTISVQGMKDAACVAKVANALKEVKDLHVDAVKVGTVQLRSATRNQSKAAAAAIKTAGYESSESPPTAVAAV